MDSDVEVHLRAAHDLEEPLILVGTPTVGLVGTIAARYVVDRLGMELVGGLRSSMFPPISLVEEGRPSLPVRFYATEASCGLDLTCEHLVVVTADFLPGPDLLHDMSQALTSWALEVDAAGMFVPDGLVVPDGNDGSGEVLGAASLPRGLDLLDELSVERLDDAGLSGLAAALLYDGEIDGVNTICLLAETAPDHPDARAAAELVAVLDRAVPEVAIETEPLLEQAERIESQVQTLRTRLQAPGSEDTSTVMYS